MAKYREYVCKHTLKAELMDLVKTPRSTIEIQAKLIPLIDRLTVVELEHVRSKEAVDATIEIEKQGIFNSIKAIIDTAYDDGYWHGWDDGREDMQEEQSLED